MDNNKTVTFTGACMSGEALPAYTGIMSDFFRDTRHLSYKEFQKTLKDLAKVNVVSRIEADKMLGNILYNGKSQVKINDVEYIITDAKKVQKQSKEDLVKDYKISIK